MMRGTHIVVAALLFVLVPAASSQNRSSVLKDFGHRCVGDLVDRAASELFVAKSYSRNWERTSLQELSSCEDCFDTAEVWRSATATLVRFEQSTETGDWTRIVDYCFDQNGRATTALLNFDYLEDWGVFGYYSARNGRFVQTTQTFRNLRTWASIPQPEAWSDYRPAHGTPAPYLTIGQLPFAAALRRSR